MHTEAAGQPTTHKHQLVLLPASMLRRVVAVVVDFLVIYLFAGVFAAATYALSVTGYGGWGVAVYFLAIDLPLTAFLGQSPGRMVAGIRVVRQTNGSAPGLGRATIRIALVILTGPVGLLYWNFAYGIAHFWGTSIGPIRLWWDSAAGTMLIRSTRLGRPATADASDIDPSVVFTPNAPTTAKPLAAWSFSWVFGVAFVVLILCLLSLTNGQAFPIWMLTGLLSLGVIGVATTYAKNTYKDRVVTSLRPLATVVVLLLGIGVVVVARPADAVIRAITIADVTTGSTRVGGAYYEITATDGTFYSLHPGDFKPQLPQLDSPRYQGDSVTLTVDRGTAGVLAIRLDGADYLTSTYSDPNLKLVKGWAIGGLLIAIAAGMAIASRVRRTINGYLEKYPKFY